MLTITLNGREEKLNIGCRTFVSLDEILRLLSADDSAVTLNGEIISGNNLADTMVKGGDILALQGLAR